MSDKQVRAVLKRHGVKEDIYTFVEKKGANAGVSRSPDPDVTTRGTVQLQKGRTIDRATVDGGLAKLKYL